MSNFCFMITLFFISYLVYILLFYIKITLYKNRLLKIKDDYGNIIIKKESIWMCKTAYDEAKDRSLFQGKPPNELNENEFITKAKQFEKPDKNQSLEINKTNIGHFFIFILAATLGFSLRFIFRQTQIIPDTIFWIGIVCNYISIYVFIIDFYMDNSFIKTVFLTFTNGLFWSI